MIKSKWTTLFLGLVFIGSMLYNMRVRTGVNGLKDMCDNFDDFKEFYYKKANNTIDSLNKVISDIQVVERDSNRISD